MDEMSDDAKRNEIIGLFTFAEANLHHALEKVSTYEPFEGYIYRIDNNIDTQKYIGSTMRNADLRLSEHIHSHDQTSEFYRFIEKNNAQIEMKVISKINIYSYNQILLREDKFIYEYDAINKGLNSKYNHRLTKVILNHYTSLSDKCAEIINYCYNYAKKREKYNKQYMEIIKALNNIKIQEPIISTNGKNWCNDVGNNAISYYNPFLINNKYCNYNGKNIKNNENNNMIDTCVLGIYLIYFKCTKDHYVFKAHGNIMNYFKSMKYKIIYDYCFNDNSLFNKIIKNGLSDMIISPIEYIYYNKYQSNYNTWTTFTEIEIKLYKIKNYMRLYAKIFIENRYDILNYTHEIHHISHFKDSRKCTYNIILYCIISLILPSNKRNIGFSNTHL